ncbi:MAG: hypothetical protein HYS65_06115, partial [Betaproteobacteria bacterium]|nr:hypothetical protein [Betaproteobacteria bacterium]
KMSPCIDWLARTILTLAATLIPFSAAAADLQRSRKAEAEFRAANPCPATGLTQGVCKGYVIDRIIPPVCGGAEDPANMQWQTIAEAKAKDKWERIGCRPGRKQVLPSAASVTEVFPLSEPSTPIEATPLPTEPESETEK